LIFFCCFSKSSAEHQEGSGSDVASDDIEIASTLLTPISLLSSHLAFLQSVLPLKMLTDLYRRVATRLSTHVLQRMIMYRGRGRIGQREARKIMNECELWLETCRLALRGARAGTGRMVEGPWRKLVEAGRLVAVQGREWERIRELTFGVAEDEEWEQGVLDVVGMSELTREEVGRVLQTRVDCDS
jgi:RAD50-interacting protein 1